MLTAGRVTRTSELSEVKLRCSCVGRWGCWSPFSSPFCRPALLLYIYIYICPNKTIIYTCTNDVIGTSNYESRTSIFKEMNIITFLPPTNIKTKTNKLIRTHATERLLGTAFQTPVFGRTEKKSPTAPKQKQKTLHLLPPGRDFLKAFTSDRRHTGG